MAHVGKLLLADDFSRDEIGSTWSYSKGSFWIDDGVFVGAQRDPAKHPPVCRTPLEFRNAVIDFRFQFHGTSRFNVVFNDRNWSQSHAGHICRAGLSPRLLTLGDDCEGVMKLGIFEKWQDPQTRPQIEPLVRDQSAKLAMQLEPEHWYRMTLEIVGDEMIASLDGKPLLHLKSAGLAHTPKTDWGFTVQGREVHFDDVSVWSAEQDSGWPARRESLFPASAGSSQ